MNNTSQYLMKVEQELRKARKLSDESCAEFSNLSVDKQEVFARAIEFLGGRSVVAGSCLQNEIDPEPDRTFAARLMFLRLYVDTGEPKWSSYLLERMMAAAMAARGGEVTDVFQALLGLLGESDMGLTRSMVNFIEQLVVLCFTRYRKSYESGDFSWLPRVAKKGLTPAQAYLILRCSPPGILPDCRESILMALENSPYKNDAVRVFSNDEDS